MKDIDKIEWPGWETIRVIGQGGFGSVYEIQRDIFGDIEKAALKVISIPQNSYDIEELYNDGYDDESITSTFRGYLKNIVAEYSLMRKMNGCANVVNCDDVRYIQHEDGIGWDIYIKMELLTPIIKALPATITDELVIKIALDICTALELCKKYEIVHRDIKPQNIFVSENGDYKLGDFGIAKTVEKTMGGTKIGTYKYMAPEVYNNQPYNSEADIYSLGLVLYWLLNERRMPFNPLPPVKLSASVDEISRNRRLSGESIPAPAHGSEELKKIVLKACAYDVKDRYSSAAQMKEELKKLVGDLEISMPQQDKMKYEDDTTQLLVEENINDSTELLVEENIKDATQLLVEEKIEEVTQLLVEENVEDSTQLLVEENDEGTQLLIEEPVEETQYLMEENVEKAVVSEEIEIPNVEPEKTRKTMKFTGKKMKFLAAAVVAVIAIVLGICIFRYNHQIIDVEAGTSIVVVLYGNGKVKVVGEGFDEKKEKVKEWKNIKKISVCGNDIAGLKSNGTVVVEGRDYDVSGWKDITDVRISYDAIVGLKKDGTLVAEGDYPEEISNLEEILAIWSIWVEWGAYIYALDMNGTEHYIWAEDYGSYDYVHGTILDHADANKIKKITDTGLVILKDGNVFGIDGHYFYGDDIIDSVYAFGESYALEKNGKVGLLSYQGTNEESLQFDTSNWNNIIDICGTENYIVGLSKDGKLVTAGDAPDISELNK